MNRGHLIARLLLKQAGAGHEVAGLIRGAGKATKGALRFGGDVAEGLGVHRGVGTVAAAGALGVGAHKTVREAKAQTDQFRAQHGLLTANERAMYGY